MLNKLLFRLIQNESSVSNLLSSLLDNLFNLVSVLIRTFIGVLCVTYKLHCKDLIINVTLCSKVDYSNSFYNNNSSVYQAILTYCYNARQQKFLLQVKFVLLLYLLMQYISKNVGYSFQFLYSCFKVRLSNSNFFKQGQYHIISLSLRFLMGYRKF